MKKRLLWLASLLSAAPATAQTLNERVTELENRVCDQSPCVAADPEPEPSPQPAPSPQPTSVLSAIAAMESGSWLHYGNPWNEAAPAEKPCGKRFSVILGAWNGWARDGLRYIYVAASGGHGDGCDNGVYRYDIQAGKAELVLPHVELNADLDTGQPFVADADGKQILPRSSHTGSGPYFESPWLYLMTGAIYSGGKKDEQVWRYHTVEKRWERLPDRRRSDGRSIGRVPLVVTTPAGVVYMGEWNICDADLVAGRYDCQKNFYFPVNSGVAWDPVREGIWHIHPASKAIRFLRRVDGVWQKDESLSRRIPDDIWAGMGGHLGICVVPDETILVWSKSADLYRYDGAVWSVVSASNGPLAVNTRKVKNKWSWDDESQTCIGGSGVNSGLWVYKPTDLAREPLPSPEPEPLPDPEPASVEGVDLEAKWSIDRDNLPSIGGVAVQVGVWEPAPWDQPIERLPGAPDYDAICEGEWVELHYRTNADLAGSRYEIGTIVRNGTPNIRIYLYPLKNEAGGVIAYTEGIGGPAQCLEVIGVPDNGRKPQIKANIKLFAGGQGLIVRGLIMAQVGRECVLAKGDRGRVLQAAFVVIHDSEFYQCSIHVHFFGVSKDRFPRTYLEMIGNVSAYAKDHVQYNERSVGRFVYKNNICFAPGWGHCLKNLAHSSLIEGNVFSNVGLDGQLPNNPDNPSRRHYGMHPLDLYGCTQTVVRDNTFIYRTSSDVRTIMSFRPRHSWQACSKGRRLAEDRWELLRPSDPAYQDPAFWAEVAEGRLLFDEGFEAARASDILFTHQVKDNRFIVLLAYKPSIIGIDRVGVARLKSLRPIAGLGVLRKALLSEARALAVTCGGDAVCYYEGASDGLKYAYDHLKPTIQRAIVNRGDLPLGVPIPAPEGWAERYAVFWGAQEGWGCDAEGTNCVHWDTPIPHVPVENWDHDPVRQVSPPRLIVEE